MLEFLQNNLGSVIVGTLLLHILGAVVAILAVAKKKGKGSCSGGCSGCPMAGKCHKTDEKE